MDDENDGGCFLAFPLNQPDYWYKPQVPIDSTEQQDIFYIIVLPMLSPGGICSHGWFARCGGSKAFWRDVSWILHALKCKHSFHTVKSLADDSVKSSHTSICHYQFSFFGLVYITFFSASLFSLLRSSCRLASSPARSLLLSLAIRGRHERVRRRLSALWRSRWSGGQMATANECL